MNSKPIFFRLLGLFLLLSVFAMIQFCNKACSTEPKKYGLESKFAPGKDPRHFEGIVSKVRYASSTLHFEIKGYEKEFSFSERRNALHESLYRFLEKGDSIWKEAHNDTIFVFRAGKKYEFWP